MRSNPRAHRPTRMHAFARSITDFGNSGLLLVLSLLIGLWLAVTHGRREAATWLLVVGACALVLALSKLYFRACPVGDWQLRSPSGHAGFSALVYGGFVYCATVRELRWSDWALRLAAALLIGLIAWSRVTLRSHSWVEAALGTGIGLAALALFVACGRTRTPMPRRLTLVLLAVPLLLWVSMHGLPLNIEPLLARWARWLGAHVLSC